MPNYLKGKGSMAELKVSACKLSRMFVNGNLIFTNNENDFLYK